ncbi:MAG: hypothetical protein ACI4QS_10750 [Comamonas sp.]
MSSGMLQASFHTVRIEVPDIKYSADIQDDSGCVSGMGTSNFAFAPAHTLRKPVYKTRVTINSGDEEEKVTLVIQTVDDEAFAELQISLPPMQLENFKNEIRAFPSGAPTLHISMMCEDALTPASFGSTLYLPQDGDKNIWGTACKLKSMKLTAAKPLDIRQDELPEKRKLALWLSFLAGALIAALLLR